MDERHSQAERNHSIKLLPTVQSLMADNGWSGKSTDLVAVGVGPGSYTGVRIAVTAGKTMAWTWDKPVIGVSSLEALALSGVQQAEQDGAEAGGAARILVYPLMDARRGQVYTAPFAWNGSGSEGLTDGVERHGEDGIRLFSLVAEEASRALEAGAEGADHPQAAAEVWFVGDTGAQQEALNSLQAQWETGFASSRAGWRRAGSAVSGCAPMPQASGRIPIGSNRTIRSWRKRKRSCWRRSGRTGGSSNRRSMSDGTTT